MDFANFAHASDRRTTGNLAAIRNAVAAREAILRVIETHSEAALLRDWMVDTFASKLELAKMKGELVQWMVGMGLTTIGLVLAGMYFLLGNLRGVAH